jgi:hypothetical protein
VFRIVNEALSHWGIGGKTFAGYGRMKLVGKETEFGGTGDNAVAEKPKATFGKGSPVEVTMTGTNKKGNPQLKAGSKIKCILPPGEVIEPEMEKGETRQFRILEIRSSDEYLVTSKKPT